jgi:hypothetical protein
MKAHDMQMEDYAPSSALHRDAKTQQKTLLRRIDGIVQTRIQTRRTLGNKESSVNCVHEDPKSTEGKKMFDGKNQGRNMDSDNVDDAVDITTAGFNPWVALERGMRGVGEVRLPILTKPWQNLRRWHTKVLGFDPMDGSFVDEEL